MDLANIAIIRSLLRENKILAKKSFGQHFLIEPKVCQDILSAAKLQSPDRQRIVLEIGPGLGILTQELINVAGKVVAVEADREMVHILLKVLKSPSNLTLIPSSIQAFRKEEYFKDLKYDLISNLPYNISSYVLRTFLEQKPRPKQMIVMIQKEVAQRVMAKPGESERSVLSLAVDVLSDKIELVRQVGKNSFFPAPKVESAVIKILPKSKIDESDQKIIRLAKLGFAQRRKKISNSLANGLEIKPEKLVIILKSSQIDPSLRPQDLTIEQWRNLEQNLNNLK